MSTFAVWFLLAFFVGWVWRIVWTEISVIEAAATATFPGQVYTEYVALKASKRTEYSVAEIADRALISLLDRAENVIVDIGERSLPSLFGNKFKAPFWTWKSLSFVMGVAVFAPVIALGVLDPLILEDNPGKDALNLTGWLPFPNSIIIFACWVSVASFNFATLDRAHGAGPWRFGVMVGALGVMWSVISSGEGGGEGAMALLVVIYFLSSRPRLDARVLLGGALLSLGIAIMDIPGSLAPLWLTFVLSAFVLTRRSAARRPRLYISLAVLSVIALPFIIYGFEHSLADLGPAEETYRARINWALVYLVAVVPSVLSFATWLSLGVSRALMGRALELPARRWSLLLLIDLGLAFALMLLTAITLFALVGFLNNIVLQSGGALPFNLTYLLNYLSEMPHRPGAFWIYGLLFFVMLPSLTHAGCYVYAGSKANPVGRYLRNWASYPDDPTTLMAASRIWLYFKVLFCSAVEQVLFFSFCAFVVLFVWFVTRISFPVLHAVLSA